MARVGIANFIHSSMKPVPCDSYWRECMTYQNYQHPYHCLNKRFASSHYRNLNTTSNDAYGSVWHILHKEDPDLDPAGVSTGVHGRMMKMGQIPFNAFDEMNANLRGRTGFGQASGSVRPLHTDGPAGDVPQSSRSSRAGSAIVGNVPIIRSSRSEPKLTGSGRSEPKIPSLDMGQVRRP